MKETHSPNLIDIQLDQLIDHDLPRHVVAHYEAVHHVIAQLDLDIARTQAKLRALVARKLDVKYGLVAKCMDDLPFLHAVSLYRSVCIVNPTFLNHPHVLRWMRKHKAAIQSMTRTSK